MTIATYGIKQNLPISDNIFPRVKNKQKPNQTKNTKTNTTKQKAGSICSHEFDHRRKKTIARHLIYHR